MTSTRQVKSIRSLARQHSRLVPNTCTREHLLAFLIELFASALIVESALRTAKLSLAGVLVALRCVDWLRLIIIISSCLCDGELHRCYLVR